MKSESRNSEEIVFNVEQSVEGGFIAHALGASIFTQAESIEQLRAAISEAVECHFGDELAPQLIRLRIVREETFLR